MNSDEWVRRITTSADPSKNFFQVTAYRLLPAEPDLNLADPGDALSGPRRRCRDRRSGVGHIGRLPT